MKIQQLLYIDDDPDDYDIFVEVMQDILPGVTINWLTICSHLATLLDSNHSIDIIFMDIYMPKVSGRECLSIIRANSHYTAVPVVFYTGSDARALAGDDSGRNIYYLPKVNSFGQLRKNLQSFFDHGLQH